MQAISKTIGQNLLSKSGAPMKKTGERRKDHIENCVPHYEQLHRHMQLHTGDRGWKATELSLIASYDYGNYSVVTIEADGWFG
ncbi:unnamed protein product [Strongylus vulgaris]|uniref:C2H2-type domain-containing protein n=1 Tax=Strongylus vulgaris TaxID=40348 RepID=A0A3P7JVR8_STRVU|nr:unnamed protein product [Strongylus vulgaris]